MDEGDILTNDENDFSPEDASAYFADKGITSTCELCKAESWTLATEVDGARPVITLEKSVGEREAHFPIVVFTCNNCGNMRFHNRFYVERWKEGRKGSSGNG